MAEGGDGQEKTEEPTQKRRQDAREEGQIVTSKELFVLTTLAAGTALLALSGWAWPALVGLWADGLRIAPGATLEAEMVSRLGAALWRIFAAGVGVGLILVVVVVLTQLATGGLIFATKALGFKASRMSPAKMIKQMASGKALVELTKALMKVGLILSAALFAVLRNLPALGQTGTMTAGDGIALLAHAVIEVMLAILLALALIGALDLAWQAYSTKKQMRMSRQEIKDEFKQTEGSPELKSQIRRRQLEATRRSAERGALDDVARAHVVVTNPTRFAVAMRYEPSEGDAPVIVAMGRGAMAVQVIERAQQAGVTRIESPPLARAIYYTGEIGAAIPADLYTAVAILLAHTWRLEHGIEDEPPSIDLPEGYHFDAFGQPQREE